MTLALFGFAVVLAAGGTWAAAAVFVLAAAVGAVHGGSAAPQTTWIAATAAGLLALGTRPRTVAVPALGAAAAIAAGGSANASVVGALWAVSTAAAVVSRPEALDGRRWAFALLQADALVAATVIYTALNYGFAAWPQRLGTVGALLLLAACVVRIPLAGWPDGRGAPALLLVRTQVVVLALVAVRAASADLRHACVAAGVVIFAVAPMSRRSAVRDAAQEAGLVIATLSVAALGWRPDAWIWGALAGGTLLHLARLSAAGSDPAGSLARAVLRSGGVGVPLLPAAAAVVTATLTHPGYARVVALVGVAIGFAARSRGALIETAPPGQARPPGRELAVAVMCAAAIAAPLVSLPRPPGGSAIPWPPPIAAVAVVVCGLLGVAVPSLAPRDEPEPRRTLRPALLDRAVSILDPPGGESTLLGLLVVLAALGAGVLVVGWLRGFL